MGILEQLANIARGAITDKELSAPPYGYCPHCGTPGRTRERRLDGNDTCEFGHIYPSRLARMKNWNPPSR